MNKIININLKKNSSSNFIIPIVLFFLTLIVYVHNLSPSVYGGDAGDLITAALSRGVPHPSGYPFYTIISIIFLKLPISGTPPAWKVGLASAVFSSLSVVLTYFITKELVKNRYKAIVTGLSLAFLYTFWLYAEIVEVIALNSAFVLALVYLTIKYFKKKQKKYFYLLAFFTGLSLTNNLIILALFPGIAISLLISNRKLIFDFKTIFISFFFLLLGLIPYIYIPLAARTSPFVNWGVAVNLDNFLALVFRKDYGWTPQESFDYLGFLTRTKVYFDYWLYYVNIIVPMLSLLGFIYLILKKRVKLLALFIISFLLFGPIFVLYSGKSFESFLEIATLEKFFVAGFIFVILLLPFGIELMQETANKLLKNKILKKIATNAIIVFYLFIPINLFLTNYPKTNLRYINIGDNFGKNLLSSLPPSSVLLMKGDNSILNSLYYQQIYNYRKDVYIPGRHEGFTYILEKAGFKPQELKTYQLKNRGGMEREVLAAAIGPILAERDLFTDFNYEAYDNHYGKIISIPYGLLYKVEFSENFNDSITDYTQKVDKVLASYNTDDLTKHNSLISNNLILADIKKLYSLGYGRIADFIVENYNEIDIAKYYLQKSIDLDPLIQN